jgi:hypothetical protein
MARKARKKRKKKVVPKRKRLRRAANAAHKAMSLYVRAVFEWEYGKCPLCSERPIQAVFHILRSKYVKALRYDIRNVIGSCHKCNWMEYRNPDPSRAWYLRTYGIERYLQLVDEGRASREYTIEDYEEIRGYYAGLYKELTKKEPRLEPELSP